MNRPPPLSPELEAFLAPHRAVSPLPPALETRAVARAAAAVEWSAPAAHRITMTGSRRWVFAAAAGTVVALGAGAYAARAWIGASTPTPTPAAPTLAPPRVPAPIPRALVPTLSAPEPDVPARIVPEASPRKRLPSRTAAPVRTSNAELQLLRTAREDVTSGDYAEALAIIGEHSRRFRNGSLVEEREALRVKSLAGLGRREEAQRAAAELQARFPHSVFLSTFERIKGKGADR